MAGTGSALVHGSMRSGAALGLLMQEMAPEKARDCSDPWGGPRPTQGTYQESCLPAALSQACPPFTPLGSLVWGAEGQLGFCVQPGKPCFAVRYTELGLWCDPGTGTSLNWP